MDAGVASAPEPWNVERADSHTVRFVARDMVELARFMAFVGTYQAGLSP